MGELAVGPEMDAEVAEKVIGLVPCGDWEVINFGSGGGPAVRKRCQHPQDACYPTVTNGGIFGVAGGCPRYSTDLAAAWTVVDHLVSQGLGSFLLSRERDGTWEVEWTGRGSSTDPRGVIHGGATPAEAICRAAIELAEQAAGRRAGGG